MKRALLILVVLAVLIAAAFFFLMPRGSAEGAKLVPADSVLYLSLPDLQRTIGRWPKTALARIGAEPAVADFLSKPAGSLAAGGGLEALDTLFRVKPDRLFFAVTAVRQNGANVLLGFRFLGGTKDVDAAMERLHAEIGRNVPDSSTSSVDYKGDKVTALSGEAPIVFSATHGSWGFLSNHEATLQQALDRAAGRNAPPALDSAADFKAVSSHLSKDPDFFWYGNFQSVFDLLIEAGNQQQAQINTQQFDQMRKLKAIGGSLLLEGENQKELTYVLMPDAPQLPPVNHSPMALTSPETTVYFDASMDTATVATDEYFESLPPGAQVFLANAKIDLKQVPATLGNDMGLILSWPPSAMIPSALLAVEIKDRAAAQTLVESVLGGFGLPVAAGESQGATVYPLPVPSPLIEPSLALTDKFLLAALTSAEMERVLQPGTATLEGSEAFKSAVATYKAGGQAFGFIDTRAIFERSYMWMRMAMIASALAPEAGQFIDAQKLPDTEVISQHLGPILYSNRQTPDGMLIESTGPITLGQVFLAGVAGGVAAFTSQMMQPSY